MLRQEVDDFIVVAFTFLKNTVQIVGCLLYILLGLSGTKLSLTSSEFTDVSKLVGISVLAVRAPSPPPTSLLPHLIRPQIVAMTMITVPYRKLVSKFTRSSLNSQAEISDLTVSISSQIRSVRSLHIEAHSLKSYTAACVQLMGTGVRLAVVGAM